MAVSGCRAQTHVDNSFGNSFAFTENNARPTVPPAAHHCLFRKHWHRALPDSAQVIGAHVMIEAAKNHSKLRRFIHVSTDARCTVCALPPSGGRSAMACTGRVCTCGP